MTFNIKELEKRTIIQCIKSYGGNKTHAANELGISNRCLRNKLALYRKDKTLSKEDKKTIKIGYNNFK